MFLVACARGQQVRRDCGHHRGLAGSNHAVFTARRIRIGRILLFEDAQRFDLRGIDVRDGEPLQSSGLPADDIDGAPVCDLGDGELRHRLQGVLIVERARQDGRGVREEGRLPPGILGRLSLRSLFFVEFGRGQRGRGEWPAPGPFARPSR